MEKPKYYEKATIECACGKKWEVGSTLPYMKVEICSACHPVFTGKEKFIDKMGRVERFKVISEKAALLKEEKRKKEEEKRRKEKEAEELLRTRRR